MTTQRRYPCPRSALALVAALALGTAACSATSATPAAHRSPAAEQTPAGAGTPSTSGTTSDSRLPASASERAAARPRGSARWCTSAAQPEQAAELSRAIVSALHGRSSVVGIAASDPADGISCDYHQWREFHAASVVKVITLCALLYELQTSHQAMPPEEDALAKAMITDSDNDAQDDLWNYVGMANLQRLVTAAKMNHTELGQDDYWGLTEVNPHDEMLLLRLLITKNPVLDNASRTYALNLMAHVTPSQCWGVPAGAATDTRVHLKNGWLPDPDEWDINSIGDFTRAHGDYSIAILTRDNPDMEYGVETVEQVAKLINQNLADP